MSSNDDDYDDGYGLDRQRGKKRRIARACDVCRKRKSRCDGSQVDGDRCSTCIDANLECTYLEAATKRTPARTNYIETLEARLERSEEQVKHLRAELTAAHLAASASPASGTAANGSPSTSSTAVTEEKEMDISTASMHVLRTALHSLALPSLPVEAEDLEHLEIAKRMEQLRVGPGAPEVRFWGKSSGAKLLHTAIDLKANVQRERRLASESASGSPSSVDDAEGATGMNGSGRDGAPVKIEDDARSTTSAPGLDWMSRRLQYWIYKPWADSSFRSQSYTFPPMRLMEELIVLYFGQVNVYLPLLHRPTFERSVREGLHLTDDGFAATVLLVCAVASRWHADKRVGAPGPGGIGTGHEERYGRVSVSHASSGSMQDGDAASPATPPNPKIYTSSAPDTGLACGWAWFEQVPFLGNQRHMYRPATLYDLQYYCLAVLFLEGSSAPQGCWTMLGVGLRLAQDLGIHRRNAQIEQPSVEAEQLKRAFWVLLYLDRSVSSGMGRPCAMQYDDFDVDLPIECDDEYWEHPTHPFQQPPGVPSQVAFFNMLMGLSHILSFSLKLLYSLNKTRVMFQINETWEENVVAELDSALNGWRDRVPEHLRFDPNIADPVFFDQSVALECGYHHLQILIHRPFIPMMRKHAPTALPSLAICTSAARACASVVDIQRRRKGNVPVSFNFYAVFTSGIVLLLNIWSGKRAGLVADPTRELANVQKCMDVVRICEDRWQHAGLLWDILAELASVGQLPLPLLAPGSQPPESSSAPRPTKPRPNPRARYPSASVAAAQGKPYAEAQMDSAWHHAEPSQSVSQAQALPNTAPAYHTQPGQSFAGSSVLGLGDSLPPMEPSAFAPAPEPETWDPPPDPFVGLHNISPWTPFPQFQAPPDGAQAQPLVAGMSMDLMDQATMAMWANAPMSVEVDDWGNYFNNFSELTQGHGQISQEGGYGDTMM
ncbi:Zn(2)-C6 fungal-type domain-containing protein [Mycena chlorophos]|uniref:Zn(2)-C6 fungal-type domain-containing protein n=1 Tax=Mycena chlorophos TaxID=658473 RepID=A0A8H6TGX9_MYCCL|nr:Zn(2)-C6 fungal-type domain-containing protein [Mycena chlorophos]